MEVATAEGLLISALLNSGDVEQARKHGLMPSHMVGFRAEYNWLLNYPKTYGSAPSVGIFRSEFPSFVVYDHHDVRSAVDQVFKAFKRRSLTEAMTRGYELMGDGDTDAACEIIREAAQPLRTRSEHRNILTDTERLSDWDQPRSYIEWPYPTVQRATGGLKAGHLAYLAARPGQGKTAHLVNIVGNAVLAGNRVRFFSMEMSDEEVAARFHAFFAARWRIPEITLGAIRDRTVDLATYRSFLGLLGEKLIGSGGSLDIKTPRDGKVTPGAVAAGADEYHLHAVDYIGLMHTDGVSSSAEGWQKIEHISNSLKETALADRTAILSAAQINREGEKSGESMPRVVNLAGGDALGRDGDVVMTLKAKGGGVASSFLLDKNRHGPGELRFWTVFDPNHGIFTEISEETAEGMAIEHEVETSPNVVRFGA